MCGFFLALTTGIITDEELRYATRFIQTRGPDQSHVFRVALLENKNLIASHYLLDVSGQQSTQPALIYDHCSNPKFLLLFNGEIYNFLDLVPAANSDTEALTYLLNTTSSIPFSALDGEYAIVIYDFNARTVVIGTDQFMTKPVSVGWSDDGSVFGVASYPSALTEVGVSQVGYLTPNSVLQFSMNNPSQWQLPKGAPARSDETYHYSLKQHIDFFDLWEAQFLQSVRKRAEHGSLPIFVPLSSGYDSGAICLALNILSINYVTITLDARENREIVDKRTSINSLPFGSCIANFVLPPLTDDFVSAIRAEISSKCESLKFLHTEQTLLDDDGAIAAYRVAMLAKEKGLLVCLSGCGADEIVSDYGFNGNKYYPHSEFGGLFPDLLEDLYPWAKFYEDSMRSYLFKDELIYGVFGIEGRYPFLDHQLTQQFLSLESSLKNSDYKAPIAHFLEKHDYPFERRVKRGFSYQDVASLSSPLDSNDQSLRRRLKKMVLRLLECRI